MFDECMNLHLEIMVKRVAVILSGCGVYDGTEIHEASAVLVHLSRAEAKVRKRKLFLCGFFCCCQISEFDPMIICCRACFCEQRLTC